MRLSAERKAKIWSVVRVSSGNFLEMYDFMVLAITPRYRQRLLSQRQPFLSLMLSLMTFGAGFLMRPSAPSCSSVHRSPWPPRRPHSDSDLSCPWASFRLRALGVRDDRLAGSAAGADRRLLQGFSAGMELGGVSVYLSEIATPGHKGFYVAGNRQPAGSGHVRCSRWSRAQFLPSSGENDGMGMARPLLLGCGIIPFLFRLRRSLQETDEFVARKHRPTTSEIFRSLTSNWAIVMVGMMMVTMTTVSFYLITAYTPTFGNSVLHLANIDTLVVISASGRLISSGFRSWGAVRPDRSSPFASGFHHPHAGYSLPAMLWLVREPTFSRLLAV